MQTDKRQLRLTISAILESHGIDDLALEGKITDAVIVFFDQTKKGIDPVKVRGDILSGMLSYLDKQRQYEQMTNRIAQAVKVTPNGSDTWNEVIKFCISQEKFTGHTIEQYAKWMIANKYDAPKVAQISMKPSIIKDTWVAAFADKVFEPQPVKIEQIDESLFVPLRGRNA